jgi:PleD family two-component response regulator
VTDISSAEDSKKNSVEDTTKKSVLIIEDMNEMRLMLRSMMLSLGYTNIEAEASGQSALKRIAAKHSTLSFLTITLVAALMANRF